MTRKQPDKDDRDQMYEYIYMYMYVYTPTVISTDHPNHHSTMANLCHKQCIYIHLHGLMYTLNRTCLGVLAQCTYCTK